MKLNSRHETNAARDLAKMAPGPARLARRLNILDEDVKRYPLHANPPAAVTAAHEAYLSAASVARQTAEGVETAKEAAGTAAGADLSAAKKAIKAGKITPKSTTQPQAADAIAAAVTFTAAAENLVSEAQAHLVDAVQEAWPEWRTQIVRDAAAARVKAAKATKEAAAAIATARGLFGAVTTLDSEVLSRDAKLAAAARAETRQGIDFYASTHTGRGPLKYMSVHGVERNLDLAVVAEALAAAVAEPGTFPAADWTPPTDPAHADLLAEPLDLTAPWVVSAVGRSAGSTCPICHLPQADTVVQDGAALILVHAQCGGKAPDAKEKKRLEARAAMSRQGYPADPNPNAGAWRKEKASAAAENAHAKALAGPDGGDGNAAMIAKHKHSDD